MQRDGVRQMIFGWFRNDEAKAKAAEAEVRDAVEARRAYMAAVENDEIMAGIEGLPPGAMDGVVPFHRSPDEARAYRFALDLIRRRGPSEASRIADLVVRNVQMLSREPR